MSFSHVNIINCCTISTACVSTKIKECSYVHLFVMQQSRLEDWGEVKSAFSLGDKQKGMKG